MVYHRLFGKYDAFDSMDNTTIPNHIRLSIFVFGPAQLSPIKAGQAGA
jgi:hypothetical protein